MLRCSPVWYSCSSRGTFPRARSCLCVYPAPSLHILSLSAICRQSRFWNAHACHAYVMDTMTLRTTYQQHLTARIPTSVAYSRCTPTHEPPQLCCLVADSPFAPSLRVSCGFVRRQQVSPDRPSARGLPLPTPLPCRPASTLPVLLRAVRLHLARALAVPVRHARLLEDAHVVWRKHTHHGAPLLPALVRCSLKPPLTALVPAWRCKLGQLRADPRCVARITSYQPPAPDRVGAGTCMLLLMCVMRWPCRPRRGAACPRIGPHMCTF